ncbi:MAG TPA: hypothetical protein VJ602_00415, partial [Paludibacter sp.]|nr:hypothetical protein [Paludibacter sp.]
MRTTILFIFSALISISIRAQEIKSYDLNVNIDVASKRIHVKGSMDVDFKTSDSISLVLWKSSSIHSIRSNQTQLTYNFDTIAPSPIMYIEQGRNLTVVKPAGSKQKQRVFVDYDCDMHNLVGWAKSFSDDWIELNFYCAWFPINGRNFTSNINVTIDDQYNVIGSGIVTKKKKYWKMKQAWSGFDNVIMASRKLKTKVLDDKDIRIELDYADLSESAADSALAECKFTFNLFESLYGAKDKTNLKLVITPFAEGGGYSRKNFISWRTKKFNFDTRCGLSHEIGHFWWSGANA